MLKSLTIVLAFAALTFAGCLSDSSEAPQADWRELVSQPVYESFRKERLEVYAEDGTWLDSYAYIPEGGPAEQFPTLLVLNPYYSNGASMSAVDNIEESSNTFNIMLVKDFLARGYAVVTSSTRGTGYSEGCFSIGGPEESKDHLAVVDATIAQPWSDGGVAALGKSYVGTTAQDLLVEGHPAVKTIIPISAISDFYNYNFVNGVPINPQGYSFNHYYEREIAVIPPYGEPDDRTILLAVSEATCDHTETQVGGFESAATGDKSPYWQIRDFNTELDNAMAPVFFVHGLQDWNVKTHHILPWLEGLSERVPVKVWLGQWDHDYPDNNRYNADWGRTDWNMTLLRWLDHWMKGIDTGIMNEPMVDVQDDLGQWRHEDSWPPVVDPVTYYLGDGTIQMEAAEPGGIATWMDSGDMLDNPPASDAGHYRLFVSEPVANDLHMAGEILFTTHLVHMQDFGTLAATLWRIDENGTWERINYAFLDLEHRNGLENAQPVPAGVGMDIELRFFPQDDVIPAGQLFAITLAGNDSPICYYTTVRSPVSVPPVTNLATFSCLPAPGYNDPGPLMQPIPSMAQSFIELSQSTLVLPIASADRLFDAPMGPYPEA